MTDLVRVTFAPSGAFVDAQVGTTVLEAAREAGVLIPAACADRAICGSCAVRVEAGSLAPPDAEESRGLGRAPASARLACRARITGPVTVRPLLAPGTAVRDDRVGGSHDVSLHVGVDLGTTNVAASAVETRGARQLGSASVPNRQQSWGADVLSRIAASMEGKQADLQRAAALSVIDAVKGAVPSVDPRIERLVIAGNTTMASLLAGVSPESLSAHPFRAPILPRTVSLDLVSSRFPRAEVLLVPPIASFVGGDTLAGLVHTGLLYSSRPSMLIDLGTNAEIALVKDGSLWVASAAAGPAFEGGGIECGGPATPGAVVSARLASDGGLDLPTLGGSDPTHLSGAGLLALTALLVATGHVASDGRMRSEGPLADRFVVGDDGVLRIILLERERPLVLSQRDVRTVQLAKAAVRAGVQSVLSAADLSRGDLAEVHVAGAFGTAIRAEDLVSLGLVPAWAAERIRFVGNASLQGALAFALEPELLEDASMRAAGARHLDLASAPGFNELLIAALSLEPYDL